MSDASAASPSSLALVCATQESARHFQRATLLGRSLQAFPAALRPRLLLLPANRGSAAIGLAEFYNRAIAELQAVETIAFVHDDVYIHDWNLAFQLNQALAVFDVVGVAGSAGVAAAQPGWFHDLGPDGQLVRTTDLRLSGCVNHHDPLLVRPDHYGPAPMACQLLDGLFLAARAERLRQSGLRFDPQFRFHCYDTDFCWSALQRGLTLGTWPIALTHGSGGRFDQAWVEAATRLKRKRQQGVTSGPASAQSGGS